MRLAPKLAAAAVAALALSGCYHAIVETGRPAAPEVITQPWAHSFVYGLVPPKVVETAATCPNGVSRVETQHSVVNMIAHIVTFGIYSPMTITVTCASRGGADAGGPPREVAVDASPAARSAAFARAVEQARVTGAPVLVQF